MINASTMSTTLKTPVFVVLGGENPGVFEEEKM
jgi:hypothetical protein